MNSSRVNYHRSSCDYSSVVSEEINRTEIRRDYESSAFSQYPSNSTPLLNNYIVIAQIFNDGKFDFLTVLYTIYNQYLVGGISSSVDIKSFLSGIISTTVEVHPTYLTYSTAKRCLSDRIILTVDEETINFLSSAAINKFMILLDTHPSKDFTLRWR